MGELIVFRTSQSAFKIDIQNDGFMQAIYLVDELQSMLISAMENIIEAAFRGIDAQALSQRLNLPLSDCMHLIDNEKTLFNNQLRSRITREFQELLNDGHLRLVPHRGCVSVDDFNLQLFVKNAGARHARHVRILNKRLSVINQGYVLDTDSSPCSPLKLGVLLEETLQSMGLHVCQGEVLMQSIANQLADRLGLIYRHMNRFLIEQGILPNSR